jgi:apolipoprotein N-acyltransferase
MSVYISKCSLIWNSLSLEIIITISLLQDVYCQGAVFSSFIWKIIKFVHSDSNTIQCSETMHNTTNSPLSTWWSITGCVGFSAICVSVAVCTCTYKLSSVLPLRIWPLFMWHLWLGMVSGVSQLLKTPTSSHETHWYVAYVRGKAWKRIMVGKSLTRDHWTL